MDVEQQGIDTVKKKDEEKSRIASNNCNCTKKKAESAEFLQVLLGVKRKNAEDISKDETNNKISLSISDIRHISAKKVLKVSSHSTINNATGNPESTEELITPRQSSPDVDVAGSDKSVEGGSKLTKYVMDHREIESEQIKKNQNAPVIEDKVHHEKVKIETNEDDNKKVESGVSDSGLKPQHSNLETNILNSMLNDKKTVLKNPTSRKFTDTSNDDDICDWRIFTKANLLPYQFLSTFMNNDETKVEPPKENKKHDLLPSFYTEQLTPSSPPKNIEKVMKQQAEIKQQLESQKKWIEDYSAVNIFHKDNRPMHSLRPMMPIPSVDPKMRIVPDNYHSNFNQKLQYFEDRIGLLTKEIEVFNRNLKYQSSPTLSDETLYREIRHEALEMKLRQLEYFHKLQYTEIVQHCQEQLHAQQQPMPDARTYDKWEMWNYARYNATVPGKPYLHNQAMHQDTSNRYNSIFQKERLHHFQRLLTMGLQKVHNLEQNDRLFHQKKIFQQDLKERINGSRNFHPRFNFPRNAENIFRHPFHSNRINPHNHIFEQQMPPFVAMVPLPRMEPLRQPFESIEQPPKHMNNNDHLQNSRTPLSSGTTSSRVIEVERSHSNSVCVIPLEDHKSKLEESKFASCSKCHGTAQFLCSACHQIWYCSRECQLIDWKLHSKICKESNVTEQKRSVILN